VLLRVTSVQLCVTVERSELTFAALRDIFIVNFASQFVIISNMELA